MLFRVVRNPALRGEEDTGQFRAEFLFGVIGIAETVGLVQGGPVQA